MNVAVQELLHLAPHKREQSFVLHNASADNNPARGIVENQVRQGQCDMMRLDIPGRVIVRERFGRLSPTFCHRRATSQSFQTVTVEWTHTGKWIQCRIVRDEHMTHFRMHQPVQGFAITYHPTTDAGSNGQVDNRIKRLGRAPAILAKSGRIYIGVKYHRDVQFCLQYADYIGVRPTRLGGGGNVTESRRGQSPGQPAQTTQRR